MRKLNLFGRPEILDLTEDKWDSGKSHGNLMKTIKEINGTKYHLKTGRKSSRDNPNKFGIEPIVECICYEFAKLIQISCAKEELSLAKIKVNNKEILTLVNMSEDFCSDKEELSLESLLINKEISSPQLTDLCTTISSIEELLPLLVFDLLIMNEDRHNRNVSWLRSGNTLNLSPIFDNGYSLMYDDIGGMLKDFKKAVRFCQCNSELYNGSFAYCETIIRTFPEDTRDILDRIEDSKIETTVNKVGSDYFALINSEVNSVLLTENWFDKIIEFLKWRVEYVRNLCVELE